jgi:hypothetical protein
MTTRTYVIAGIYFGLWITLSIAAFSSGHSAPSAYPDGLRYYDYDYSPYPPQQPQTKRRINPPEASEITPIYIEGDRDLECQRIDVNTFSCEERP